MGLRILNPLMPLIIGGSIDQGFVSPDCPLIPNPSPSGRREPNPVPLSRWEGARGEGLKIGAFTHGFH
jgi:hypothetical protein